ncbi:hypothetical protein BC827DRAFT_1216823 [Russula dissimulans]|nr:hypothetical protein BC827DRAFT_1216823 [Russula dissimulans]
MAASRQHLHPARCMRLPTTPFSPLMKFLSSIPANPLLATRSLHLPALPRAVPRVYDTTGRIGHRCARAVHGVKNHRALAALPPTSRINILALSDHLFFSIRRLRNDIPSMRRGKKLIEAFRRRALALAKPPTPRQRTSECGELSITQCYYWVWPRYQHIHPWCVLYLSISAVLQNGLRERDK